MLHELTNKGMYIHLGIDNDFSFSVTLIMILVCHFVSVVMFRLGPTALIFSYSCSKVTSNTISNDRKDQQFIEFESPRLLLPAPLNALPHHSVQSLPTILCLYIQLHSTRWLSQQKDLGSNQL